MSDALITGQRVWTSQPGWPAPVSRYGLGRGVQMLLLPVSGVLIDVVNGRVWSPSGNANAGKPTNRGLSASFDGTDDYYAYTGYPEIVGSVGTFFIWLPRIGAFDGNGSLFWGTNTTASVYFQMTNIHQPVAFGAVVGASTNDIRNTTNRSLVFASDGTAAGKRFIADGTAAISGGGSSPVAFAAGNKSFRFGAWVGGATFDCDMDCVVAGYTTRVWSEIEARAFHANPWQLFAPLPRRVFAPSVAAGGGFQAAWARNSNVVINPLGMAA